MARVVQQRSNPPYLVILFVALFLIAGGLAVWMAVSEDKAKKDLAKNTADMKKIVSQQELQGPTVQRIIKDAEGAKASTTVVGELVKRNGEMIQFITGDVTDDPNIARACVDRASAAYGSQPGLAIMVSNLIATKVPSLENTVKERDEAIKAFKAELAAKDEAAKKASDEYLADKEGLNKRVAELDTQLKANQEDREKAIEELRKAKDGEIASLGQTNASLTTTIATKDKEIARLNDMIAKGGGGGGDPAEPNKLVMITVNPDGKISKVIDNEGLVYIDVGAKDHVAMGMTFAVYPSTGIVADKKSDNSKAKIVVTAIYPEFSVCKVVSKGKNALISQEDLVANAVFDRSRVYKFVVEGQFDLTNSGRASLQGTEEVKTMVKRFGGEVQKELSTATDYVIVGEEPAQPPKAEDGEPAQVKANREAMAAELKHYRDVIEKAQKMGVPVLNMNRFAALIGYDASISGNH